MDEYKCGICGFSIGLVDKFIPKRGDDSESVRMNTVIFPDRKVEFVDIFNSEIKGYKILRKDMIRTFKCPVCGKCEWEMCEVIL